MDEILSMVALGDGGSNKRGRFLKSMGRYMVMRKLFGRRYYSGGRRAAVSRSAGNGTGGGTGGNAGSSSGNEPAPSGESNSQRASSHTNNSGSKPVREPVRANENVNGTENNGASENERTTVSYGSKTQSAGTKAGKRVGMVMDSGKRLKDRMSLVKENVKNTPTEIKYQAGLHRKAIDRNVKDLNVIHFFLVIAGERNRRETGRLQEQNRIQADAGRKRREMYLAKRRSETALKRYDGIDFHQRIPVNGKELDKYRGVDGLNHGAKAGKSFIDSRGQVRKASDEKLQNMAGSEERIRKNDQKAEHIGTPLEDIRYKNRLPRIPITKKDLRKELVSYGTMFSSHY